MFTVTIFHIDKFDNTPLLEAIKSGHDRTASLLVKEGALLNIENVGSFLCMVITKGGSDLLRRLLSNGVDPSTTNATSRCCFSYSMANRFSQRELTFNWKIVLATVIGFLGSAFGTIGGICKGGIFVPMLTLILGFDTKLLLLFPNDFSKISF